MKDYYRYVFVPFVKKNRDNFMHFLARKILPKRLVYFCAITVGAYATTGKYSNTVVPDITFMEVIKRYGVDHGID